MTTVQRIAALILAALSVSTHAEPLVVNTRTTGTITSIDYGFHEYGNSLQAGVPIAVDFNKEISTSFATIDGATFTSQPDAYFYQFGIAAGGNYLNLGQPWGFAYDVTNRIQLQDNVLNAAGVLVDVLEISAYGQSSWNTTYFMSEHLEFASTTFDNLDAWSILALEDATLLGGTMHVRRFAEGWDATYQISNMYVDIKGFNAHFEGPGAEVPAVPEPNEYALLLAGLACAAVWRRPRAFGIKRG